MAGIVASASSVVAMARVVKRKTGRGYREQMSDLRRLKRTNPTCGSSDYYWYQMWRQPPPAFGDFLGWRSQQPLSLALNPRVAVTAAWDKLVFATLAHAHGIPTAALRGAFRPGGALPSFIPDRMGSKEEVRAFLERDANFPVFVKPAYGQQGFGGFFLVGRDEAGRLITKKGEHLAFDDFIRRSIDFAKRDFYRREAGYLFQEVVEQHPAITDFSGTEVPSGFRIVVLNDDDGPVIHRAVWKLTLPGNSNDNFSLGKYGNIVADVEEATGTVTAAVNGLPPRCGLFTEHPVSGRAFRDFTIPGWDRVREAVLSASSAFGLMRILHWDVVLTAEGPTFLELNDLGGTEILQVNGRPLVDDRLKDFLRRWGTLEPYPRLKALAG